MADESGPRIALINGSVPPGNYTSMASAIVVDVVLSLPVFVANVRKVFDASGHIPDPSVETLIRGLATTVMNYIHQAICPAITLERVLREGATAVGAH
jgi:hypothetical protein